MTSGFHFIGDVHGCGEMLEGLLRSLGYSDESGVFRHDNRQAIFVGDLIDRGPQQLRALEIVKGMVDAGTAQMVMGNHEFNALAYATFDEERGVFCREHNKKNQHQHKEFLEQLNEVEQTYYLAWFVTLPLWLDLDGVRVIHACWHEQSRQLAEAVLGGNTLATTAMIIEASRTWLVKGKKKGTALYEAVEVLLKGPELDLTKYHILPFKDKGGDKRDRARVRWWFRNSELVRDLVELPSSHYQTIPNDLRIDVEDLVVGSGSTPVFYGHYWREWGPEGQGPVDWSPLEGLDWTPETACVDFSAVRQGPLVAYQWDQGDTEIVSSRFIAYR